MRFDDFTFIHPEIREKAFRYLAGLIGDPEADLGPLMDKVETTFEARWETGQIVYLLNDQPVNDEAQADAASFRLDLTTPTGEEIHCKCNANRRPGARQKWFGLFFVPARREGYYIGDLAFRTWTDGMHFLDDIAEMAIPEKWNYAQFNAKTKHPILKSFIEKTYERVKQQERLIRRSGHVLFNSGLINTWFKEIYIVCESDPELPGRLVGARPVLENDRFLLETFGAAKPAMPTFFENITDVVFDPNLEVNTNDAHIIDDNFDRIPDEYKTMRKSQIFALFQAAIEFSRIMARRNYKLIIPQFFGGQIQFLMPIYLSGEFIGPPDFALALEKINDCYRGNTILTLDMAYQNARLIAKPDTTWLNP